MKDKSLGIFLMVLFGISGMAVLMLAWLWPVLASERIMATLAGSAGLFVALTQVPALKHSPIRIDNEHVPANVETEDRS